MNKTLIRIKTEVYDKCGLEISDFKTEHESVEYEACRFELNKRIILSRSSKITPKKGGQFVTFWKRNDNNTIEPFHETDRVDFFVVNVRAGDKIGQFVFPKSILIQKGIISTDKKEGKRAFRVYPDWDIPKNKSAERAQKWQLDYFFEMGNTPDLSRVKELYNAI